ncbi:MAG: FecR domain-containing protein [Candidatus Competibacterales bacterium]
MAMALALLTSSSGALAEERPVVGTVEAAVPRINAVYGDDRRSLATRSPVRFRDILTTGSGARMEVRLADGSEVTLGENTELLVDEFIYQPQEKQHRLGMRMLRGAFLFTSGRGASSPRQTQIRLPVAVLGVRGTTLWGGTLDECCEVFVFEGEVTVSTDRGSVTLTEGEGTKVIEGNPPTPPKIWGQAKIDRARALVTLEP